MKSGIKTSEFWLSLVAIVYTTAISTGLIPHSNEINEAVNSVSTLLIALGYTWARAFVKGKDK